MTRPNTPPAENDIARLIARVTQLERKFNAPGPTALGDLDDVNVDYPADADSLIYDATLGKWKNNAAATGNLWSFASAALKPSSTVLASLVNFRLSWGGAGSVYTPRTVFEIWDDGGTESGQYFLCRSPGDFTVQVVHNFNVAALETINFTTAGGSPAHINVFAAGDLNMSATGNVILTLPTSDPGVSGAIWNDGGTVKVSP